VLPSSPEPARSSQGQPRDAHLSQGYCPEHRALTTRHALQACLTLFRLVPAWVSSTESEISGSGLEECRPKEQWSCSRVHARHRGWVLSHLTLRARHCLQEGGVRCESVFFCLPVSDPDARAVSSGLSMLRRWEGVWRVGGGKASADEGENLTVRRLMTTMPTRRISLKCPSKDRISPKLAP
jgi:hypothetical protein